MKPFAPHRPGPGRWSFRLTPLALLLTLLLVLCLSGLSFAQTQVSQEWVARYEGSADDYAYDIAVDAYGNSFVTGQTFNGSNKEILTIKYDTYGNQRGEARYNGDVANGEDGGIGVAVDVQGNVYVAGYGVFYYDDPPQNSSQDIVVLKYDNNLVLLWAKHYNSPFNYSDVAKALALDSQGNVYVTGTSDLLFYNQQLIDQGWVTVAYSSGGTLLWPHIYNYHLGNSTYPDGEGPSDIAVDNAGYVYVTGIVENPGTTNYDWATLRYTRPGGPDWARFYSGNPSYVDDHPKALAVDASGNVVVTGTASTGPLEWTTIKYDRNGNSVWPQPSRILNGDGVDVVTNSQGDVFVLGSYAADFETAKLRSSDGSTVWTQRDGEPNQTDSPKELALDGFGDVYVTGTYWSSDYLTVKHKGDDAGTFVWSITYNGGNLDQAQGIALDPAGNVYVTGLSRGSGTFDDYATVKYNQREQGGGFLGYQTEPSQGRHLVRDQWTGELHLVMTREDNKIAYAKSTDNGASWVGLQILDDGKYPTVCIVPSLMMWNMVCVAYKPTYDDCSLMYQWFDPGIGQWQKAPIATSWYPGPPSMVTDGFTVYVAYRASSWGPQDWYLFCNSFPYYDPSNAVIDNVDLYGDPEQPCLAVDGYGRVYGAWRTQDIGETKIWYAPRGDQPPYWASKLQVDMPVGVQSQQPFVECYGESLFVVWSEGTWPSLEVLRRAKAFNDPGFWPIENASESPSYASESPIQAWQRLTTWSEGDLPPFYVPPGMLLSCCFGYLGM